MAPVDRKTTNKNFTKNSKNWKKGKESSAGVKKNRKWISQHKVFEGSVKEGQGFALKRKQKVKYEYNKLLKKEKKRNPDSKMLYKEEYPEHLKHLYMAEEEKLKKEAWENRVNRTKHRMQGQETRDENEADEVVSEPTDSTPVAPEETADAGKESLPMSNRMKKKLQKKTSYQKTKEEFEKIKEKRKKKKEEYLKNKQQREEAIKRYKQKKMETFQILSKKTKKGQPNLNLQMDYLLQKIQGKQK
ncbi:thyroid transcription factor 1-associated protein 26 homolog [Oryzias melastigma]|uniref:Coiled-coil domain containing 59 n=1 Tax=Oryzias melastigma TaxID=30732 RepID=A0A3B3BL13_ORYME|nr:thyroid transcription factor 1-associated protein 26 homolog [Oryzias melastigma]